MTIDAEFTGSQSQGSIIRQKEGKKSIFKFPCHISSECSPLLLNFTKGTYDVTLYGAKGGDYSPASGGNGGKAKARFYFSQKISLFLYIGGRGNDQTEKTSIVGGYNGGGSSNLDRGSGGGATDLRTILGDYNSRIIVAGGGGGAHRGSSTQNRYGGSGGGLKGGQGKPNGEDAACYGTQTGCEGCGAEDGCSPGTFGEGSSMSARGGGGGGYWGGGSATSSGSSGGSGFISPLAQTSSFETGCNEGNGYAIIEDLSNKDYCTSENIISSLHFSLLLFIIFLNK